eukprot:2558017-Rhodomonas_salina.2
MSCTDVGYGATRAVQARMLPTPGTRRRNRGAGGKLRPDTVNFRAWGANDPKTQCIEGVGWKESGGRESNGAADEDHKGR